jgi:hypothetical protein
MLFEEKKVTRKLTAIFSEDLKGYGDLITTVKGGDDENKHR